MKAFWTSILKDFELEEDACLILRAACENFDRAQIARQIIATEGITLPGGKRHPAVDVEAGAYALFLRALRQLGLDIVAPGKLPGRRA